MSKRTHFSAASGYSAESQAMSISEIGDDNPRLALDRMVHLAIGRLTQGISPSSVTLAYLDWLLHLQGSPAKWVHLSIKLRRKLMRLASYALFSATNADAGLCIEPLPQDHRFRSPQWQQWPFNLYCSAFLLTQQWWHNATTGVRGVSKHHEDVVEFMTRQILDLFSPSNFVATNPEVIEATAEQGGGNFLDGLQNLTEDVARELANQEPVGAEDFRVGKDVAVTPGKVVYRNDLVELIQYSPTTDKVQAEPILFIPAWIMKYYILDLSPHNSVVKYLVDRGHTVFMVSWRNPTWKDANLGMDDYRRLGVMLPLNVVSRIIPGRKIHAVGYCLGGTMLTIAAATMARDEDDRLASLTLFATQTDFSEVGEISLFIDESQVTFLEDLMWEQGYLDARRMSAAFQLLRSTDLIWSRMVRDYLLGNRRPMIDLMAWNQDTTRLPYRMHKEYLRHLFIDNELFEGKYEVEGSPVAISNINVPIFVVSTEKDHVAPWHSVYKIHLQADAPLTFVLTNGGHNAGIISEPGHDRRHYRVATSHDGRPYVDPDVWLARTPTIEGSWWPEWESWLSAQSSSDELGPRTITADRATFPPLCDAPGTYVLQK
jgi:polyhydroxyalkanoate synthase